METSNKLTGQKSNDPMLFAVATHVNHFPMQENGTEKTTLGICGLGFFNALAHYDRDTQSWKMCGDICLWGEHPSLQTLPASGMTRNGALFQQPVWERITKEIASSLWPTPVARDSRGTDSPSDRKRHTPCLPAEIHIRAGTTSQVSGKLNPMWVEWLMGFPTGWTDCDV